MARIDGPPPRRNVALAARDARLREELAVDERVAQLSPLGKLDFAGDLVAAAFAQELAIVVSRFAEGERRLLELGGD